MNGDNTLQDHPFGAVRKDKAMDLNQAIGIASGVAGIVALLLTIYDMFYRHK
ncbi:hypothetical protein V7795_16725 [Rhizobium laguerreae]|uniref:hypothetical protein n=1 Tax=Rhizobium laguerreae TaxID=1076926 RepID=UPI002FFED8F8